MIRYVSYPKAVLAGMAGAVAWEVVARLLILAGLPFFDIVRALGTLTAPHSAPFVWWALGMAFHFVVGAIWAVFYAYFFWSVLTVRPLFQGIAFAFVPMPLAILVMRPQLELMHSGNVSAPLSSAALFGLGGLAVPLSIAAGHLIWGLVLGMLYTRPVGYAVTSSPHLTSMTKGGPALHQARDRLATAGVTGDRFMFATGIECSYPTLGGGRWRMDQMEACGHYRHWKTDLALVRELGLRYLRYGPPLHLIYQGPGQYNWEFLDEVAAEMQRQHIIPIMDLVHFGLPSWLGNFQNPEVPHALRDYATAFARRYPWVRLYTPVNEMYVCAKLSALEGLWNEQCQDERSFVTAVRHLAKANVLMMEAISAERPTAVFVNSESGEFYQPCCPDPEVRRIADFENERRFLPLDLLYANAVNASTRAYLFENGMPADEYAWFMRNNVASRAILGVDYYDWNEKLIDSSGKPQSLGELFGWYVIASQYYDRYRRPMMHTETNHLDAREAPRWLWRQWHNVQLIRASGVPVVGFTWYSLTDQIDWNIALRAPLGNVNPVGLFDLNRDVRPVGQGYAHLVGLFEPELAHEPLLEDVLRRIEEPRRARPSSHA